LRRRIQNAEPKEPVLTFLPFQLTWFVILWLAGEALSRLAGAVLPGGVIGLALLLLMLWLGALKLANLKRGADWLLAQMLLFFVPAVLVVLEHREFAGALGLKILLVIVASTMAVMASTALVVEFAHRLAVRAARADPE
jgi:holin-like protein